MTSAPVITGLGEVVTPDENGDRSLELLIFQAASAALAEAGLGIGDLDGIVIAASDMVDGRAISSMLTSGPAGAYLNEEINMASSPGHALAMGYLQILSGTHRRLLVSSWGKASESRGGSTQAAERLSAEPFFDRDGGLSVLAAAAFQAQAHRAAGEDAAEAAAHVAGRNHGGGMSAERVRASEVVAHPLRRLELPPETDGAFSILLERADRETTGAVSLAGVGWCTDSGRIAQRDLAGLPHLARAAGDAFQRARLAPERVDAWELHDYTPDAELLAYGPLGLCAPGDGARLALSGESEALRINSGGGSVVGEAPFGGPLRKVVRAARTVRDGEAQAALAQVTSGFAGQFQSVFIVRGETS